MYKIYFISKLILSKKIITDTIKNIDNVLSIDENKIVSYIKCFFNNKTLYITFMFTYPRYCNKGYATILLNHVMNIAINNGLKVIELDDCSVNYRTNKNIYINAGLNYIDEGPEMSGHIQKCIKKKNNTTTNKRRIIIYSSDS